MVSSILADLSLNTNTGIFLWPFITRAHSAWVSVPLPDDQTQEGVLHGNWRRGSPSQDEPAAGTQIPLSAGSRGADQEGPGEGRGAANGETIWLQLYHTRWEESQPLWVSVDLTLTVSGQVRGVPSSCVKTVSGCWGVTDGQMIWFQLYHARWEGSSFLASVAVKAIPVQKQFDANCITPGERGPSLLGSVYVEGLRTGVSFEKTDLLSLTLISRWRCGITNLKLWLFLPNLLSYWWYSLAPLKS